MHVDAAAVVAGLALELDEERKGSVSPVCSTDASRLRRTGLTNCPQTIKKIPSSNSISSGSSEGSLNPWLCDVDATGGSTTVLSTLPKTTSSSDTVVSSSLSSISSLSVS